VNAIKMPSGGSRPYSCMVRALRRSALQVEGSAQRWPGGCDDDDDDDDDDNDV